MNLDAEAEAVEERMRLSDLLEGASTLMPLPDGPPPLPRCPIERPRTRRETQPEDTSLPQVCCLPIHLEALKIKEWPDNNPSRGHNKCVRALLAQGNVL